MIMPSKKATPADILRKADNKIKAAEIARRSHAARQSGLAAMAESNRQMRLEEAQRPSKRLPDILERNRFVTPAQAAEFSGFSVPHIRRLYRTGGMPAPICLGGRKLGWKLGTLMEWVDTAPQTKTDKAA